MEKEAIVPIPYTEAGVGPFCVMDDLESLLDARRCRWTGVSTVVVMVIGGPDVVVW